MVELTDRATGKKILIKPDDVTYMRWIGPVGCVVRLYNKVTYEVLENHGEATNLLWPTNPR